MKKQIIFSEKAPKAIGPYSQGIQYGNMIFLSGQIPITVKQDGSEIIEATTIEQQTKVVLENIQNLLESTGATLENIVKTTCYITNLNNYTAFNEVYSSFFTKEPPARSCVEVSGLPKNVLVELDIIAFLD